MPVSTATSMNSVRGGTLLPRGEAALAGPSEASVASDAAGEAAGASDKGEAGGAAGASDEADEAVAAVRACGTAWDSAYDASGLPALARKCSSYFCSVSKQSYAPPPPRRTYGSTSSQLP